ncbi:PhnD/SsuA/transferrin family substrate-binding protein [Granulicella tundricola]|uniref:4,5-dihydroxyphthalate decarboxylase n=1 Tax=Granulicella tundricola (strain ATCC BAA-1859 / DSM 23138 / MP5ACTX9) TaxID=1198114 RepID=E8WVI4_GRATM|nr:PhnD/SsuA/transferrin family substrate-binding protein [Granulicella tundricola]ADW68432.1 4,5-dihydroxyphthalate decarboxylase [Granulicella tundricola MP5ACTX9]
MANKKLDLAFWDYDRTRALVDGTVKIDGVDGTFHSAPIVTEIFRGMIADGSFDVSELGFTYFLRTFKDGESPFVAIPVFPNRAFRHSAIFVNKASGIEKPEDLNGKTIGELALYSHDAGIMPKGMLMDEFGFKPETCRWVIGGLDWPLKAIDFVPHTHPANVEVSDIAKGKELGAMLEAGEIDALISADVPKCMLEHSPKVRRLFPDSKQVEQAYYKRTGIFPIMHTVVIRRDLLKQHPELAQAIYQGFCDAKKAAEDKYRHGLIFNSMGTMFPWFSQLVEEDVTVLGEDWWPYGIAANRKSIDAVLRYHHEQGITDRLFTMEDIFLPEFLGS